MDTKDFFIKQKFSEGKKTKTGHGEVALNKFSGKKDQVWRIRPIKHHEGLFSIIHDETNFLLDGNIPEGSPGWGWIYLRTETPRNYYQMWALAPSQDGRSIQVFQNQTRCNLDGKGREDTLGNSDEVYLLCPNEGNHQLWILEEVIKS